MSSGREGVGRGWSQGRRPKTLLFPSRSQPVFLTISPLAEAERGREPGSILKKQFRRGGTSWSANDSRPK